MLNVRGLKLFGGRPFLSLKREISKELDMFRKLLIEKNSKVIRETTSNSEFWNKNGAKFPYFCDLALQLYNINSSSAHI